MSKQGYCTSSKIFLHNFILNKDTSTFRYEVPDHKNRNRLDCRKSNLAIVSRFENAINKGRQSNNKSGYPGVCLHKKSGRYRSYIKVDGKQISLGYHNNLESAIDARKIGELKYFGKIINRQYDINTVFRGRTT